MTNHLLVSTETTKPKSFDQVDTATYLKYIAQAEELVKRGYCTGDTRDLAEKLWKSNN